MYPEINRSSLLVIGHLSFVICKIQQALYELENRIMDKVDDYRQLIEQLLVQYSQDDPVAEGVETLLMLDTERHHYAWMNIGWDEHLRVYDSIVHFDIKDGKIWIQRNLTEADPAEDLVQLGVAKEDIVLGLHPPYKRPYTGYGVA